MIFFYSFSIILLINRLASYNYPLSKLFIVSLGMYILLKTVLKQGKVKIGLFLVGIIALVGGVGYFYYVDQLEAIIKSIYDYFYIYYLSFDTGTIYIDGNHLFILIVLIVYGVEKLTIFLYEKKKTPYIIMALIPLVLIGVGIFTDTLMNGQDQMSFILAVMINIAFYFYNLYVNSEVDHRVQRIRNQFFIIGTIMAVFVVLGAQMLNGILPSPFQKPEALGVSVARRGDLSQYEIEKKKIAEDASIDHTDIRDTFEYDYVLVMLVESEKIKYLKTETYELYHQGKWYRNDLPKMNGPDKIYQSKQFENKDYEKYYTTDQVKVEYKNILTNYIIVNGYGTVKNKFGNIGAVHSSDNKGVYFKDIPLDENYEYEFTAVVPAYGTKSLTEFIIQNEERMDIGGDFNLFSIYNHFEFENESPLIAEDILFIPKDMVKYESSTDEYSFNEVLDEQLKKAEIITKNGKELYLVRSASEELVQAVSENETEILKFLHIQFIDSNVQSLAEMITQEERSSYKKALLIEEYLKSNYEYSETPYVLPDGKEISLEDKDKIWNFLFENKRGFCQHFASSMVLMLKSIGIEARYVTGYRLAYPDEIDDSLEFDGMFEEFDHRVSVYDSNAHSWVEAYFPEVGWIMFEPTPVMNYRVEESASQAAHGEINHGSEKKSGVLGNVKIRKEVVYVIVSLIVVFVIIGLIVHRKRKNARRTPNERLLVSYDLILLLMAHRRNKKFNWETPREYARRIDEQIEGFVQKSFVSIIHHYEKIVFGDKEVDENAVQEFLSYKDKIKPLVRRHTNILTKLYLKWIETIKLM